MVATYAKTPRGQAEIEQRSGALGPRGRRMLILFDGRRDVDEIRALVGGADFDRNLRMLQDEGYVELLPPPVLEPAPEPAEAGEDWQGAAFVGGL